MLEVAKTCYVLPEHTWPWENLLIDLREKYDLQKKRKRQNWNVLNLNNCLNYNVWSIVPLLPFLGVVVCDLIFVIFSALQAHAAEQFSYQTEICSWQQEAELHSMTMEDEIPVWLLEEIMSI